MNFMVWPLLFFSNQFENEYICYVRFFSRADLLIIYKIRNWPKKAVEQAVNIRPAFIDASTVCPLNYL